jgi:small subunit ribosomal protein S15
MRLRDLANAVLSETCLIQDTQKVSQLTAEPAFNPMTTIKELKQQAVSEFKKSENDTGSSSVQIALLTKRINHVTEHMRTNKKDYASRRGLLTMVSRRRGLLDYVRRHDPQQYLDLLARLGIRK